jgi:hypothetical protein
VVAAQGTGEPNEFVSAAVVPCGFTGIATGFVGRALGYGMARGGRRAGPALALG